jgi:hypothetical protein
LFRGDEADQKHDQGKNTKYSHGIAHIELVDGTTERRLVHYQQSREKGVTFCCLRPL